MQRTTVRDRDAWGVIDGLNAEARGEAENQRNNLHRKLGVGKGGEWKPLSFMYGEEFAPLT